jgi:NAD(P)-dependent dehydrogenase (short-subunit alcohol dehydrogenase family)
MASNPSFNGKTGATEVAHAYSAQVQGKIVLITGVSQDGIGEATARAFAAGGASTIIITGRDDTRLSTITTTLSTTYPSIKFLPHKLDLTSLSSVQESATALMFNDAIPRIDILVANAGGNFPGPKTFTPDGLETHLAVNHLGHFLFVRTLLPKLRLAAQASVPGATRIVVVSSLAIHVSPFRFSDYNFDGKPLVDDEQPNWAILKHLMGIEKGEEVYNDHVAYAQSKTANSLFVVHINTLYEKEGISAFALHPGGVQSRAYKRVFGAMTAEQQAAVTVPFDKNIDQGAATTLVAALDPGLKPENAAYLSDCQAIEVPEHAISREKGEKLWELSEKIVAEKLQS